MVKKFFNKYNIFLLYLVIFVFLLVLSYFFPLSGNDYFLYKNNITSRLDVFQFGYIGDYLSIVLINNRLLRAFVVSITIFVMSLMVGKIIKEDDKNIPLIFMILFAIINSNISLKTIVNISGFSTYFFPLMLLSIYLYIVKKIMIKLKYSFYQIVMIMLLSFFIGLFNDYLSMFMIVSNVYLLIYMLYKKKKFDFNLFSIFIVSIISLALMFNSFDLLYNSKHIFDYKNANISFIVNGIRNYFNKIQNNFLTENFLINIVVSFYILIMINNKNEKNTFFIKLLSMFIILFNIFVIITNIFDFNIIHGKIHYFTSIISFLYLISIFILVIKIIKKKEFNKFLYLFTLLFLNIIIYSLSYNLKDSSVIYLYYLYILIALEIIVYFKNYFSNLFSFSFTNLSIIFISFLGVLIYIYNDIYLYNLNRDTVILDSYVKGNKTIYIPIDNFSKYVYNNYPVNEKMEKAYLSFLDIEFENIDLEYIENSSVKYKLEFFDEFKYNNLMIVAHPDDELIWGGKELMDEDYVVVCVTCGENIDSERVVEFSNVMNELNDEFIMLGHTDLSKNGKRSNWEMEYNFILEDVREIINHKKWNKIVVHSPFGESGHIHHKLLNKITTSVVEDKNNLYYFGKYYYDESKYPKDTEKISADYVKRKDMLFKKYYKSQSYVKFEMFYPYEKLYSYKEWHAVYDPKYEYN